MTVGLIARADNSGLGTMSWEFTRHIDFDQVKIISNGRYKIFPERFKNIVSELKTDITLAIETPYDLKNWIGKKILIPMYECTHPGIAEKADVIISPSLLDKQFYPNSTFIPFPINRTVLPFKERKKAHIFVHNAGHGGLGGRNGTKELIEAMRFVKSDIQLIINSQIPLDVHADPRIIVRQIDVENYWELWNEGDVFIFPEKFNGLSLPIQEAMSVGMAIMATDRYPFNAFLPKELLIPSRGFRKERIATWFESAIIEPKDIAEKIDEWAGKDISKFSKQMDQLAEMMSWPKLLNKYKEILK